MPNYQFSATPHGWPTPPSPTFNRNPCSIESNNPWPLGTSEKFEERSSMGDSISSLRSDEESRHSEESLFYPRGSSTQQQLLKAYQQEHTSLTIGGKLTAAAKGILAVGAAKIFTDFLVQGLAETIKKEGNVGEGLLESVVSNALQYTSSMASSTAFISGLHYSSIGKKIAVKGETRANASNRISLTAAAMQLGGSVATQLGYDVLANKILNQGAALGELVAEGVASNIAASTVVLGGSAIFYANNKPFAQAVNTTVITLLNQLQRLRQKEKEEDLDWELK